MKKLTFQRRKLYEEVWSIPMIHLAEMYGVKNYHLTKVCKELDIPMPSNGYWAKKRNGIRVKVANLPESDKTFFVLEIDDKKKSDRGAKKSQKMKITPQKLNNLHPLVQATWKSLKEGSLNQFNRINGAPLDVSVAPECIDRAMRIMDTVLKKLQKQGREIHCQFDNCTYKMYLDYGRDKVYLQLRENGTLRRQELSKEEESSYRRQRKYEYLPNGELKLVLRNNYCYDPSMVISDTASKKLEDRLDEFFEWLKINEKELHIRRLEWEERDRQLEIERRIEEEAERRRKLEIKRRKILEVQSELFTQSQYIYDFIKEIENKCKLLDLDAASKFKLDKWIVWAREHADRLNPVNQVINSILKLPSEEVQELS